MASALGALYGIYNAAFTPLLDAGAHLSVAAFSLGLAAVFTLIYWKFLDVEKQQELREELNDRRELMEQAQEHDDTEKVSEHMSEMMDLNRKFMMLNIKPMIATMVFVALIFPWLGATFSPGVPVNETMQLQYGSQETSFTLQNDTADFSGLKVEPGDSFRRLGVQWEYQGVKTGGGLFSSGGERAKFSAVFVPLPVSLPLIGDELNWLGFYALIAMPLTYGFRKALGIA